MAALRRLPDGSTTTLTAVQLIAPKMHVSHFSGRPAGFARGGLVPDSLAQSVSDLNSLREVRGSDQTREAAKPFINQPLTNRDSNITATVSANALRKMMSKSSRVGSVSDLAHYHAVANLDRLFQSAIHRESRPPREGGENNKISQFHHFEVPMPFQDDILRAKILAKEHSQSEQGTRLYNLSAVQIEKPASYTAEASGTPPVRPAGFNDKFAGLLAAVKQNQSTKGQDSVGFANGGKVPSLAVVAKAISRKMSKEDLTSFLKPGSPIAPSKAAPAPKLSPVVADMLIQSLHYPYNDMPSIEKSLKQRGHIALPQQVAGAFANANPDWQREDVGGEARFHPPAQKVAQSSSIAQSVASPPLPVVQQTSPESPTVPPMPAPVDVVGGVTEASKPSAQQPYDLIDKYHGPRSLWETMNRAGVPVTPERGVTVPESPDDDSPFVERLTRSITKYLNVLGGGGASGSAPDSPSSPSTPAPVPSPTQPASGAKQTPRPLTDIISGLVTSAFGQRQAEFLMSPPAPSFQPSASTSKPVSIIPQSPPKLSDVVATMRSEARSTSAARSPRGKSLWQTMGQQPAGFAAGGHVGSIRPPSPEDTVPAMLKPNEVVLNEEQQQKLGETVGAPASKVFQKIGVPGFASGGKVPEAGGLLPTVNTRAQFQTIGHDGASALAPQGFAWGGLVKGAMKVAQFSAAVAGGMARDSQPGTVGGMANTVGRGVMSAMTGDIGGVVEALKDLKQQLVQFKDNTIQTNQSLAKYNATLALAYANLNIGRISRDIRMASATGETASRLVGNQNKLENEQLGVGVKLANTKNSASRLITSGQRFGNMALEGGMNLAGSAVNGVSRTLGLGEATKWLEKIADFAEQTADSTRKFAEDKGSVDKGPPKEVQLPGLIEAAFQLQPWNQQAARDRVLKPFQ